ncbi:MAG: flagellar basal body rod protein FlgF [Pseudomonadota bacterium]
MDRMLYVAMSGAKETMLAQTSNANNLANVNTPGFLQDLNQFRSMPLFGVGYPTRVYAMSERPQINFAKGPIQQTGNTLDVAVQGDGFIAIRAKDGSEAYTRRGDLKIDANGILTNGAGYPILGNGGTIALPPGEKVEIGYDGSITVLPEGQRPTTLATVDRIKLVNPKIQDLEKGTDGLLRMKQGGAPPPPDATVLLVRGAVESSNVNPAEALVTMIDLARRYDIQVKMISTAQKNDESAAQILRPS